MNELLTLVIQYSGELLTAGTALLIRQIELQIRKRRARRHK